MTAGQGYVAAGGQHGQLDVRRLCDGAVVLRGAAGGSVNNALALAPTTLTNDNGNTNCGEGGVTLFVCNNDCSIKAYALPPPIPPVTNAEGTAPRSGSGSGRRRRGVRGGGGSRRNGGENDENEMMELDEETEIDNECDDFTQGEEDEGNGRAADTVAAAFEDHHFDSLEQQRREQQQQQQQQRGRRANGNVEAGRETLMASLEARVAAAVAAAVGAAAGTIEGGDTALRPRSANEDNIGGGRGRDGGNPPPSSSSSAALLRRRANAAAAAAATANASASASASASRAARLAAGSPAAVVRCLDPVNYCAPSPANARGVPGFGSGVGSGSSLLSAATLAAVGDCPSLSLHVPTESGYAPLASWDLFDDAGMACAWSASGTFVSAVAQCGSVACVDPRVGRRAVMRGNVVSSSSSRYSSSSSPSSSVVARWRTPGGGAARALKASPAGAATDFLLVTEHDTFAHLVDARRFDAAQTLEVGLPSRGSIGSGEGGEGGEGEGGSSGLFSRGGGAGLLYGGGGGRSGGGGSSSSGPTAHGGHHLSGAAFSPEGDLAFVGAEDGGVAVFDVKTAERCCVGERGYR